MDGFGFFGCFFSLWLLAGCFWFLMWSFPFLGFTIRKPYGQSRWELQMWQHLSLCDANLWWRQLMSWTTRMLSVAARRWMEFFYKGRPLLPICPSLPFTTNHCLLYCIWNSLIIIIAFDIVLPNYSHKIGQVFFSCSSLFTGSATTMSCKLAIVPTIESVT